MEWSRRMLKILRDGYGKKPLKDLCRELHVSRQFVKAKAIELGIDRLPVYPKLGKHTLTEKDIEILVQRCTQDTFSAVAESYGVLKQSLMAFVMRYGLHGRIMEGRKKNKKRKTATHVSRPIDEPDGEIHTAERKEIGQWYWVASDDHVFAYKAKEKGDAFDDKIFSEGRYFDTEQEALKHSAMICKKKRPRFPTQP